MIKLFSEASGVIAIIIDIIFAVLASVGNPWYFYIINIIALCMISSIINTAYIQGVTRAYSFFYLYGIKGIYKARGINVLTIIAFAGSYFILSKLIFSSFTLLILYCVIFISLSTFIAFVDNHFSIAIRRTIELEK